MQVTNVLAPLPTPKKPENLRKPTKQVMYDRRQKSTKFALTCRDHEEYKYRKVKTLYYISLGM